MKKRMRDMLMRMRWLVLLPGAILVSLAASADDYAAGWGPAIGSTMPVLDAPDQSGERRSLQDLSGDQGLLLFLSRSADW